MFFMQNMSSDLSNPEPRNPEGQICHPTHHDIKKISTQHSSSASEVSREYVTRSQIKRNLESSKVGKYELRSLTSDSKNLKKNPVIKAEEADGNLESKVDGLDSGGPFHSVVRRPRSINEITRGEVVTTSTTDMSWGARAKIVRPEGKLKNKDVNSFSKTILDTESANNEDPEGIVAASKTRGKSKGTATKFTPLRSAQTPVQDTLHLPAVDGCDLSTDETNRRVFKKDPEAKRPTSWRLFKEYENQAGGKYDLRSLTGDSKNLKKNPEADVNLKTKVDGLDRGGPFHNVVRRPRSVNLITRGEVVTASTTNIYSSLKSWGACAKIVRPQGKLKNKDVNSFSKTVTSVSRSKGGEANKHIVVVDLKEYNDVEKEVAEILLLMSKNACKELILDTKSANNGDLEEMVATSKTRHKRLETATKFTLLRNAQTPIHNRLQLPTVHGCHMSRDDEAVFAESVITARREKKIREGRHLNIDESPSCDGKKNRIQIISNEQLSSDLKFETGECSRRIQRQSDVHVGEFSRSTKTKQEVALVRKYELRSLTGDKSVDPHKDIAVVEIEAAEIEAAKTLVLISKNAYKELTQDKNSETKDADTDLD
ncbi:hypothetical protein Tco_1137476 [Tanacetum coccineum]